MNALEIETAALRAFEAGTGWPEFWSAHHKAVDALGLPDGPRGRLTAHLLHLVATGDTDGQFAVGDDEDAGEANVGDVAPISDMVTRAKLQLPPPTTPGGRSLARAIHQGTAMFPRRTLNKGFPLKNSAMSKTKQPKPPNDLSRESKQLWKSILEEFSIDDRAGQKVLEVALYALDRAESCRKKINSEGEVVLDRFHQAKPHPLLAAERDARAAFLQGIGKLNLDLEPLQGRPGRPSGR